MSSAHKIDQHIVDKITLMAYGLNPHGCAKAIKARVDKANRDSTIPFEDYLLKHYVPPDAVSDWTEEDWEGQTDLRALDETRVRCLCQRLYREYTQTVINETPFMEKIK